MLVEPPDEQRGLRATYRRRDGREFGSGGCGVGRGLKVISEGMIGNFNQHDPFSWAKSICVFKSENDTRLTVVILLPKSTSPVQGRVKDTKSVLSSVSASLGMAATNEWSQPSRLHLTESQCWGVIHVLQIYRLFGNLGFFSEMAFFISFPNFLIVDECIAGLLYLSPVRFLLSVKVQIVMTTSWWQIQEVSAT